MAYLQWLLWCVATTNQPDTPLLFNPLNTSFSYTSFWTADWFAGLVITLVVLIGWRQGIIDSWFERPAYDLGVRMANGEPSDQIAIIAIDDQSIQNIGRWPWSREVHANMIEILEQGGAKVIGSQVMFLEEQIDPGLESISYLADYFASTELYESGVAEIDILSMAVDEVALAAEGQESAELLRTPEQ